jgi:hypothetical protein
MTDFEYGKPTYMNCKQKFGMENLVSIAESPNIRCLEYLCYKSRVPFLTT